MRERHTTLTMIGAPLVIAWGLCGCLPPTTTASADAHTADAAPVDAGPVDPLVCPALPDTVAEGHLGAAVDSISTPTRRVVIMGGSTEVDAASALFVDAANGGDILVLRASGSVDSYTPYFFSELTVSISPASVSTLRTDDLSAGGDDAVLCRVGAVEALWLAGGDQWHYLGGWPVALHHELAAVTRQAIAFGGTSAGAMVLGEVAFDARSGGLTSEEALAAPLAQEVSLSQPEFFQPELEGHVVDTHFSQRNREGRLLVFLARSLEMLGAAEVSGVGLDEKSALVIEDGGFTVLADAGGSVWLYAVSGPAVLTPQAPLDLENIRRVQLSHGDTGVWPLDWQAWPLQSLAVSDGIVQSS